MASVSTLALPDYTEVEAPPSPAGLSEDKAHRLESDIVQWTEKIFDQANQDRDRQKEVTDTFRAIDALGGKMWSDKARRNRNRPDSMSEDLLTTTKAIHKAIRKLKEKNYSHVQEYCIEINRLENMVDRDFRDALGRLFDEVKDPILIIKWKEIYEHLEDASDRCEDVANVLEAIVLKYA